jgi:hypothetical protein
MRVKGGIPPGIRFVHDPQIPFASGATNVIPLTIQADNVAKARPFVMTAIIASEHDSDESFSTIDLAAQIVQPHEQPRRNWWPWVLLFLLFVLFSVGSFYLAWSLRGGPVSAVPKVVGDTLGVARETLAQSGYQLILLPTTTDDLDGKLFKERSARLLSQIKGEEDLTSTADDEKNTNEQSGSVKPATIAVSAEPTLESRLIWYVDGDRFEETKVKADAKSTSNSKQVGVKVVPEVIELPNIMQSDPLMAAQTLADVGLRFRMNVELPIGYRYGQDNKITIWSIEPKGPYVFHGSLIKINILPNTVSVPDFSNSTIQSLGSYPHINALYIYKLTSKESKQTDDLSVLQSWTTLLTNQGNVPYIYRQIPGPGTQVQRDNHTITIYLDSRRSSQ